MTRLTIIDILHLIRTAREIFRNASDLLDLPDTNDPQAIYAWTRAVITVANQAAKVTPTPIDDQITAWLLNGPLQTYDAFLPYYRIFKAIIELTAQNEPPATIAAKISAEHDLAQLAPPEQNPIQLIQAIATIIRLILELMQ